MRTGFFQRFTDGNIIEEKADFKAADTVLTVASYNVHRCIGIDGRRDPFRIAQVIGDLKADIVGLQEVETPVAHHLAQMEDLGRLTGLTAIPGFTMERGNASYGNVLLVSLEILEIRTIDLSVSGREPRGAIDALLRHHKKILRVIVTHLGLKAGERRAQIQQLMSVIDGNGPYPLILLGDVNEWFPLSRNLRVLDLCFGKTASPATFPANYPCLALDRIWVHPKELLKKVYVRNGTLARGASDHLPVVGKIAWEHEHRA